MCFTSLQNNIKFLQVLTSQRFCQHKSSSCPSTGYIYTHTHTSKTVGPCALPIHPMTNWWRMRGHKSFIAFDRRPSPLVLEQIVKIPHNPSFTMRLQQLEPIPLVGPCALPIHPTTNWWKMRGQKFFITFDRRPSSLVLERIVKIPHKNISPSSI